MAHVNVQAEERLGTLLATNADNMVPSYEACPSDPYMHRLRDVNVTSLQR